MTNRTEYVTPRETYTPSEVKRLKEMYLPYVVQLIESRQVTHVHKIPDGDGYSTCTVFGALPDNRYLALHESDLIVTDGFNPEGSPYDTGVHYGSNATGRNRYDYGLTNELMYTARETARKARQRSRY